jgi:hypothetical protein
LDRGTAHHYIERDRIFERVMPLERIIFFDDIRFDLIMPLFERMGAIIPGRADSTLPLPNERSVPPRDIWAKAGADNRARVAASRIAFFIENSSLDVWESAVARSRNRQPTMDGREVVLRRTR